MCKPQKMNGAKGGMGNPKRAHKNVDVSWSRLEEEWAKGVMARMVS